MCKQAGKLQEDGRKLACWGMTFIPRDGDSSLLGQAHNIYEASKVLFPLLAIKALHYSDELDWFKFTYTGDRKGAYVAPAYTYLIWYVIAEGEPILAPALHHLQRIYPGDYARNYMSMLGPYGPD